MSTRLPVTRMPGLLIGLLRDRGRAFSDLAREFPQGVTVVMPGRSIHVLTKPEAVRHLLVEKFDAYHKGLGQAEARAGLGSGLLTAEADAWARHRNSVNPILRPRAVALHAVSINRIAAKSVDAIARVADGSHGLGIGSFLARYTIESLAAVMQVPCPDPGELVAAFDVVQNDAMFRAITQDRVPGIFRRRSDRQVQAARARLEAVADQIAAAVQSNQPSSESPLPWTERGAVISLLLAGYETTSATLHHVFDVLSRRADLQNELHAECADVTFESDDPDTVMQMASQLPLARAVIKETLRLHPPVWMLSRRAQRDDSIAGWSVRKGDDVCVITSEIQREGWSDPDSFLPARHLSPAPEQGSFHAFGVGPRSCPGVALANLEATTWLAHACQRLMWHDVTSERANSVSRMSQTVDPRHRYLIAER